MFAHVSAGPECGCLSVFVGRLYKLAVFFLPLLLAGFLFLRSHLRHMGVPGPGIKSEPPLRQPWILNLLCHSGPSSSRVFKAVV